MEKITTILVDGDTLVWVIMSDPLDPIEKRYAYAYDYIIERIMDGDKVTTTAFERAENGFGIDIFANTVKTGRRIGPVTLFDEVEEIIL